MTTLATETIQFTAFPKIARLYRDIVVTEKIDGTNAAVGVTEDGRVYAQSRKRLITPEDDNFGFARWVDENAAGLTHTLGVGLHFGEWWGSGIQRRYGLTGDDKRFSLFNTARWEGMQTDVLGLGVVPILYSGVFREEEIQEAVYRLIDGGSLAAPGFMGPEGVVTYHTAANQLFKTTIKNDEAPKGVVGA